MNSNTVKMTALDKIFREVERDWKGNRIKWVQALRRLHQGCGWSVEQAARWLATN